MRGYRKCSEDRSDEKVHYCCMIKAWASLYICHSRVISLVPCWPVYLQLESSVGTGVGSRRDVSEGGTGHVSVICLGMGTVGRVGAGWTNDKSKRLIGPKRLSG